MREPRTYLAIDLKSFYASAECVDRGLDPLRVNLAVADESRTERTICLAVSPTLKALGIGGRPRLFEVRARLREVNAARLAALRGRPFSGESADAGALAADPALAVGCHVVPPRMARYLEVSTRIYGIYLRFVAPEDIHVYSIDEVFMDVTGYLRLHGLTARALASRIIRAVREETGITATAGIAPNLYLSKVALDLLSKHAPPDADGIRAAELDVPTYRRTLWSHRPLTDFWRIGRGTAARLEANGLRTLGDIARCSARPPDDPRGEALLRRLFGVEAEILIDHAWGEEPCTIADIRAYRPAAGTVCAGQVLPHPYPVGKARLAVREMADSVALDLVARGLRSDRFELTVGYDRENVADPERFSRYCGPVVTDGYGRALPKPAHGSCRTDTPTASARRIAAAVMPLFDRIVNPLLTVRRLTLSAGNALPEGGGESPPEYAQDDLFTAAEDEARRTRERETEARDTALQKTLLGIRRRFGANAVIKAMSLEEGATARLRNTQIGGHRA